MGDHAESHERYVHAEIPYHEGRKRVGEARVRSRSFRARLGQARHRQRQQRLCSTHTTISTVGSKQTRAVMSANAPIVTNAIAGKLTPRRAKHLCPSVACHVAA